MSDSLAPVVLFCYNRPEHTRRTIEALACNELASKTELTVFADGPRSTEDAKAVADVRAVCHNARGFARVNIVERPHNLGLAANIINGVTETVSRHGRLIVVEDDNVTSPRFLRFMNDALARYADEDRVMHVAGYMYRIPYRGLPETFFYRVPTCSGGWATWDRAWKHFRKDVEQVVADFGPSDITRFNVDGVTSHWAQIEGNRDGRLNTWAVFWYASVFRAGGLCLHPYRSLVRNIGFDGTGEHCARSKTFAVEAHNEPIRQFSRVVEENPEALLRIRGFLANPKGGWLQRRLRRAKRLLKGKVSAEARGQVSVHRLPNGRADLFISVVTGTLNRRRLLPAVIANTVDSDPRLELVLVDGGSTDGTIEYIRKLDHPRVTLIEVGHRSSYPHFMNLGIRRARHDFVCQWNDDVLLLSSWDEVIRALDDAQVYLFAWKKARFPRFPGSRRWQIISTVDSEKPGQIVMNFGIYHKDVFRKVGLYNPAYQFYYADADMSYRAWAFGSKVKHCHQIRAVVPRSVRKSRHYDAAGDRAEYDRFRGMYALGRPPDSLEYL